MKPKTILRDTLFSILSLAFSVALSTQFQKWDVSEHITSIFIFNVFLIALFTEGYVYGIVASIIGTISVNFAFTYPYFVFDFIDPVSVISAIIMVTLAVVTSLLATQVKRHEESKAESERERMRANLLRAVSHDLRTPLTTIYSASTMLKENKASLSEAQQDEMLGRIQEDAQWLVRMVENLLSVTRIDNNTMKISKVPTILDELIDSVVSKFSAKHPSQNITLSLPDEIVVIPMDPILIGQVIQNLLENAVFHAEGMTELSLRVYTLGDQAIFEVADNGCGIEESTLRHIFTGCYEVQKDVAQEKDRFAGIGLSICSTIVKAHGGTITAENRKGGGALFRFTLQREECFDGEQ